jgi:hypothetical protein
VGVTLALVHWHEQALKVFDKQVLWRRFGPRIEEVIIAASFAQVKILLILGVLVKQFPVVRSFYGD